MRPDQTPVRQPEALTVGTPGPVRTFAALVALVVGMIAAAMAVLIAAMALPVALALRALSAQIGTGGPAPVSRRGWKQVAA